MDSRLCWFSVPWPKVPTDTAREDVPSRVQPRVEISFAQNRDDLHIRSVLCHTSPKLAETSHQLMRLGANSKTLMLLTTPPHGLTVPYLKDAGQMALLMKRNSKEEVVMVCCYFCIMTSCMRYRLTVFIDYCVIIKQCWPVQLWNFRYSFQFLHFKVAQHDMGSMEAESSSDGQCATLLCRSHSPWPLAWLHYSLRNDQALGNDVLPPPAETMEQFSNIIGDLLLKYRLAKLLRNVHHHIRLSCTLLQWRSGSVRIYMYSLVQRI